MFSNRGRRPFLRRLRVQALEPRLALAVVTTVIDGDLIITGDSGDNTVVRTSI